MSLVCSISGNPPTEPVVSPQGCIFERSEIESHLRTSDHCPVTGEVLSETALFPVMPAPAFVLPRSGSVKRSVPMMLKLFRMELDECVLSNLGVRGEIRDILEELLDIKMRRDAAGRIIFSLREEIEASNRLAAELRSRLASSKSK